MKKDENTSENLLKRYLASSSQAPFLIHERYQNRLIQLARKQLLGVLTSKVDPADVAQEAFLAFFDLADRGEVRWQKNGDLWRLLAGIAANKAKQKFDFFNAAKRDSKKEIQISTTGQLSQDDSGARELAELVDHLLSTEKPMYRSVLELRLAGYSNYEIGERVGRSSRTIRRVLESLQAKLIANNELDIYAHLDLQPANLNTSERAENEPSGESSDQEMVDYKDLQLLRMIGLGSFAKVYLTRKISTGELFALKTIRKKWFSNLAAQAGFFKEAQILGKLNHPGIVKLYGVGKLPNGALFLLLEFVEGKPIAEAAQYADPELVTLWIESFETTITEVHHLDIVHGDIRSSNVLVDKLGQIRVIDFGLSGLAGQQSENTIQNDLQAIERLKKQLKI